MPVSVAVLSATLDTCKGACPFGYVLAERTHAFGAEIRVAAVAGLLYCRYSEVAHESSNSQFNLYLGLLVDVLQVP